MKKAWRWLEVSLCGAFLAALFLLAPTLISGPDDAAARNDAVNIPVLYAAQVPERETETLPDAGQGREQRGETGIVETRFLPVSVCVRDRNGMPLTGRTWCRTVYLVCPPEGVPG